MLQLDPFRVFRYGGLRLGSLQASGDNHLAEVLKHKLMGDQTMQTTTRMMLRMPMVLMMLLLVMVLMQLVSGKLAMLMLRRLVVAGIWYEGWRSR